MTNRTIILFSILAALLGLTTVWSYGHMASQKAAARRIQADLAQLRRKADRIKQLRETPIQATEYEQRTSETTGLIEKAARVAKIHPEGLSRITPEPLRRIGDTVYKEKPTEIQLRKVTLKQFTTLTHALLGVDAGLRAKSIRLSAPRLEKSDNLWTAELVVTYLIYAPRDR